MSRIVVGVDGSPSSLEALRLAVREAQLSGAQIDAVIAWHYPTAPGGMAWAPGGVDSTDYAELAAKVLAECLATVGPPPGVVIRECVREGIPAQVLLEAADGAELLVVGSRGHGGLARALLGSVSMHCVHHARCPVLVARK
jgi:nucleotide-binding universal stress UspA family protein